MNEWIPLANFLINLLIIPLVKILWDIKVGLASLEATVLSHSDRLDRIERNQDR